jgi:hypothetical protein
MKDSIGKRIEEVRGQLLDTAEALLKQLHGYITPPSGEDALALVRAAAVAFEAAARPVAIDPPPDGGRLALKPRPIDPPPDGG